MPLLGQSKLKNAYAFIRRNQVPRYRVGARRMLFDKDEVKAWVQSRRVGAPLGNRAAPAVRSAIMGGTLSC